MTSTTTPAATGADAAPTTAPTATGVSELLPCAEPVQFLDETGALHPGAPGEQATGRGYRQPTDEQLVQTWRRMVIGRRFDAQASALTKQGRLAVYPSSRGQDACQVAPVVALEERDWLFPTYRDSMALVSRDLDPVEALTLLRGDWHSGYDPKATRIAPQCTPLATQMVHTAGVAHAMARRGTGGVALGFVGDGGTSEGDFHEGLNFAAVFNAPAIFFVQNNLYAISVPLSKQSKAPALAYKGVGYGVRSEQVDGNDAMAVLAVMSAAIEHARSGGGPFLIEAHTYRLEAHTNADDATRYRQADEVTQWQGRDPIVRLETWLRSAGLIDDATVEEVTAQAEAYAADLRERMNSDSELDPMSLFDQVYAEPTAQLREQAGLAAAELVHEHEGEDQ